jgi:hypothetical protein
VRPPAGREVRESSNTHTAVAAQNPATGTGTCWLFSNEVGASGQHSGDGVGHSKCYVPGPPRGRETPRNTLWGPRKIPCTLSLLSVVAAPYTMFRGPTGDNIWGGSRAQLPEWAETVGDCRYPNGQHSNYKTLTDQPSEAACKVHGGMPWGYAMGGEVLSIPPPPRLFCTQNR